MYKKIIIPLLALVIIGVAFLFTSNILVLDTSQEITKIDSKSMTPEKLAEDYIEYSYKFCQINPNIAYTDTVTCNRLNDSRTENLSILPIIYDNGMFDKRHCSYVNMMLNDFQFSRMLVYSSISRQDGFVALSEDEQRNKAVTNYIERFPMDMIHYDIVYKKMESLDKLLLFWNNMYENNCSTT